MEFGKIVNGEFISCPLNGYLKTGEAVSNLPELLENNSDIRISEGYKQVIDSAMPEYASDEYLELAYTEDEQYIYRQWQVKKFETELG